MRVAAGRISSASRAMSANPALGFEPFIDALHDAADLLHLVHALLDDSGRAFVAEGGAADEQHRPEGTEGVLHREAGGTPIPGAHDCPRNSARVPGSSGMVRYEFAVMVWRGCPPGGGVTPGAPAIAASRRSHAVARQ